MSLKPFEIDRYAHDLILEFREKGDVLVESHKMRMATAYGLERFWGEHLRLQRDSRDKADFWKKTWTTFCKIMKEAGINVPNDAVNPDNTAAVKTMTDKLWSFDIEQRKIALAVLTELCDSMVWWTQRYRKSRNVAGGAANGR
ncbi:hypothetical protein [Merismopedia glauca]|uniref:CRISPR type III-B/RAMP module-associated protein Cmr5 n=1 Tax=Merismopedia glauca CCAP 1448/3 TaxID=1296344 RepID=A0A2T1BXA8_9CYAN|nr:hypothetical protein [Merismopedia glauca]PSB00564.1 hypothetical protein C7B64_22870 [Merismopedia glauca CCAP 1448/3]